MVRAGFPTILIGITTAHSLDATIKGDSYHDETNGDLKIITQNESCAPIGSGDWVIGSDCSLITSLTIPNGNILVENNSQLTIHPGVTLDVDFLNHHLMINLGSNIVIKSGGAIT